MTKQELIKEADKVNKIIYSIKAIRSGANKGFSIEYAYRYNKTTCSDQKSEDFWNMEISQIANEFCN